MVGREFIYDGKDGIIYSDGEIYIEGEFFGKLYQDGDIYIDGEHAGRVYDDGSIYIDGVPHGRIYEDGEIYVDSRQKGKIYRNETTKESKAISNSSYAANTQIGTGFGSIIAETGVFGLTGLLLAIIVVCGSCSFWVDGIWHNFEKYAYMGNIVIISKIVFALFPICALILQCYRTVKKKYSFSTNFFFGLFLQAIAAFLGISIVACILDGIDTYVTNMNGELMLISLIGCPLIGAFPTVVGSILGSIIKKIYWSKTNKH